MKAFRRKYVDKILNDKAVYKINYNKKPPRFHCELIQSKDLAERIAARVMAIYPSGTRTVTSEWRGNEQLNLFDNCDVKDHFGGKSRYMLTSIKNSIDGGFKQEVKGIRKKKIIEGSY